MHGPTHNRGHTLDLLISRGLNISSIVIKDVAPVRDDPDKPKRQACWAASG